MWGTELGVASSVLTLNRRVHCETEILTRQRVGPLVTRSAV